MGSDQKESVSWWVSELLSWCVSELVSGLLVRQ